MSTSAAKVTFTATDKATGPLARASTVTDLASLYLQISCTLDRLELRATPQGVIESLLDAKSAVWSGLEVAKNLAAMSTEEGS